MPIPTNTQCNQTFLLAYAVIFYRIPASKEPQDEKFGENRAETEKEDK